MFVRAVPRQSVSSSPSSARPVGGAPVSSSQSFTQVGSLQPSKETGPEEESFRYAESWDELQKRQPPKKKADEGTPRPANTLGELSITPEILSLMISWRAQHEAAAHVTPSAKKAAFMYRDNGKKINEDPPSAMKNNLF